MPVLVSMSLFFSSMVPSVFGKCCGPATTSSNIILIEINSTNKISNWSWLQWISNDLHHVYIEWSITVAQMLKAILFPIWSLHYHFLIIQQSILEQNLYISSFFFKFTSLPLHCKKKCFLWLSSLFPPFSVDVFLFSFHLSSLCVCVFVSFSHISYIESIYKMLLMMMVLMLKMIDQF